MQVSRRRGTALVILLALMALPVSGTICVGFCASASPVGPRTLTHHGGDAPQCHESPPQAPLIGRSPSPECLDHHASDPGASMVALPGGIARHAIAMPSSQAGSTGAAGRSPELMLISAEADPPLARTGSPPSSFILRI